MSGPLREPSPAASQAPRTWAERWRDIQAALVNTPRAVRMVWDAHPWGTLGIGLLTILSALLPASQAWVGKLIVDTIVRTVNAGSSTRLALLSLLPLFLLGWLLVTLGAIFQQSTALLQHIIDSRLSHTINTAIIRKALALDMRYFEDAEFYNKLQNARREADYRALHIVNTLFSLIQGVIILASFGALLLTLSPLVVLILLGATLPSFIAQARYGSLYFRLLLWRTPEFRRMQYLEYLLTVDRNVKEVKLFGLGEFLLRRYQNMFWTFYEEDAALARQRSLISIGWGLLSSGSLYGAYAWVAWQAMTGAVTLGDFTLYLAMFHQSQATFRGLFSDIGQLYESSLFLDNLFSYLKLQPQVDPDADRLPLPRPIRQGIEFCHVSFRYPGYSTDVLRDVNLRIAAGECLALVGANGAGKTTLIKLLTRLYDPTDGHILIDGTDLRDYDQDRLHQAMSVIFQDFVQYQATVRENIGFGQVSVLHDDDDCARAHDRAHGCAHDEEAIAEAAHRGGADTIAARLPRGYDTMLGHWFAEGHELSGGEWQKVALSRAFLRDSDILILDEPTASLDLDHEHEIFERFHELTRGKTTILISHRLSTVRMADRIAVLEGGRITEIGTHEELLERKGTYQRLFRMQAQRYRTDDVPGE
ncbi:MAG: ABC transporter ATP-binding protein [Chloroflexaceae bacterium]|nr:ABC transporter ATP-binding protein [Chloroflexaceae bacterium]